MLRALTIGALLFSASAAAAQDGTGLKVEPLIKSKITGVEGHKALVARVIIPPKTEVAAHYHPNEEFLYIARGETILRIEGQADKIMSTGMATVIPAGAVHVAINMSTEEAVAMVFRVHPDGQPIRLDPSSKKGAAQ